MRLLLDAGLGTELLDAGLPRDALPESWLLARPDVVGRVHASHAAAGAQVVLTCTFNLAGPRLRKSGIAAPLEELARRAVDVARQAAPGARIAGAVGPTLLAGSAAPAELRERYEEAFRALALARPLRGCAAPWRRSAGSSRAFLPPDSRRGGRSCARPVDGSRDDAGCVRRWPCPRRRG